MAPATASTIPTAAAIRRSAPGGRRTRRGNAANPSIATPTARGTEANKASGDVRRLHSACPTIKAARAPAISGSHRGRGRRGLTATTAASRTVSAARRREKATSMRGKSVTGQPDIHALAGREKSREVLEVREILVASAGLLVRLEIAEIDEAHRCAVDLPQDPGRIALLEPDAGDRGEDLQADGRHAHPDDLVVLQEQIRREVGDVEAEFPEHRDHRLRRRGPLPDPDVHVHRRARIAVVADGVPAHQEVLNLMSVEQL